MSAKNRNRTLILTVNDDPSLSEMPQIVLRQEGFDTTHCATGTGALAAMRECRPDLMLLDLMLPGCDGVNVCRDMRAEPGVSIVMFTAKSETDDVVAGLQAGVDDYVAKPFKTKELLARTRTRLRRASADPGVDQLTIGDLVVSTTTYTVKRGPVALSLTPLEFDLLLAPAKRPSQVLSQEALLDEVWGYRNAADTRLVNVHMQRLRFKVEKDPEHPEIIVTVRETGYRADEPQPW